MWRPSWRWGDCTGHCPEPWMVTSRAQVPPLSTATRGAFDHRPRPEALSPVRVLRLGWGKAYARDHECETPVETGCDALLYSR